MKPPLYRLSYSAVLKMAAALGFEPSRPSAKPGALPNRRRGNAGVAKLERAARIELASSAWKAAALPLSYARFSRRVGVAAARKTKWRMVQGSNLRDPKVSTR